MGSLAARMGESHTMIVDWLEEGLDDWILLSSEAETISLYGVEYILQRPNNASD